MSIFLTGTAGKQHDNSVQIISVYCKKKIRQIFSVLIIWEQWNRKSKLPISNICIASFPHLRMSFSRTIKIKTKTSNATSFNEQEETKILLLWHSYHSTMKCRKTMADIKTRSENLQGKGTAPQNNTKILKRTEKWPRQDLPSSKLPEKIETKNIKVIPFNENHEGFMFMNKIPVTLKTCTIINSLNLYSKGLN